MWGQHGGCHHSRPSRASTRNPPADIMSQSSRACSIGVLLSNPRVVSSPSTHGQDSFVFTMPFYKMLCISAHFREYVRATRSHKYQMYSLYGPETHQRPRNNVCTPCHGQRRCRPQYRMLGNPNTTSGHEET